MFLTMMRRRIHWMNDQEIVKNLIMFIEQKERELQTSKFLNDQQMKNDVVKSILDELERETINEN